MSESDEKVISLDDYKSKKNRKNNRLNYGDVNITVNTCPDHPDKVVIDMPFQVDWLRLDRPNFEALVSSIRRKMNW